MKTIVLIYPAIDFEDNYPCSWIPFSVLAVGSALPQEQFRVLIFDENRTPAERIFKALTGEDIFLIGISIMTGGGQIKRAIAFAKYFKSNYPTAYVVFGGPHANVLPKQTAECVWVDYVLCGPGQESFPKLAMALANRCPLSHIAGLYAHAGSNLVVPKLQQCSLKQLSPYRFDLIDVNSYIRYDATIAARTINYIASQGCPYGCSFCYEHVYGKRYYTMEVSRIHHDIKLFAEQYGVTGIKFYDADFFINPYRVEQIISFLKDFHLSWAASVHPKDILRCQVGTENLLLRMIRDSGCRRLLMGMESGSNRILNDVVHKNITREELLHVAKLVASYDILGSYTFMVGYPDETAAEQEETFRLIFQLIDMHIPIETKVHIYLPYPGTPLYSRALELGFVPPRTLEDWSDFNYYKAMTPWTDVALEEKIASYTHMVDKNNGGLFLE